MQNICERSSTANLPYASQDMFISYKRKLHHTYYKLAISATVLIGAITLLVLAIMSGQQVGIFSHTASVPLAIAAGVLLMAGGWFSCLYVDAVYHHTRQLDRLKLDEVSNMPDSPQTVVSVLS